MISAMQRLGFTPSVTIEQRKLAVDLAEVVIKWELQRIKDQQVISHFFRLGHINVRDTSVYLFVLLTNIFIVARLLFQCKTSYREKLVIFPDFSPSVWCVSRSLSLKSWPVKEQAVQLWKEVCLLNLPALDRMSKDSVLQPVLLPRWAKSVIIRLQMNLGFYDRCPHPDISILLPLGSLPSVVFHFVFYLHNAKWVKRNDLQLFYSFVFLKLICLTQLIEKVGGDIQDFHYNSVISLCSYKGCFM